MIINGVYGGSGGDDYYSSNGYSDNRGGEARGFVILGGSIETEQLQISILLHCILYLEIFLTKIDI